jgi:hypothetical protein
MDFSSNMNREKALRKRKGESKEKTHDSYNNGTTISITWIAAGSRRYISAYEH